MDVDGEVVDSAFDDPVVVDAWRQLGSQCVHPFGSWAWMSSTARHLEHDHEVRAHRLVVDGSVVAVAATVDRGPGSPVVLLGDPLSDRCGPVHGPGHEAHGRALLTGIVGAAADDDRSVALRDVDPAIADALEADGALERAPSLAAPRVDVRGTTWDAYLDGPTARRRRRIATAAARLLEDPQVHVVDATSPAEVADALESLIVLHEARFGATSRLFTGRRGDHFRHVLPTMAADDGVRILLLCVDDRPVGATLVLRAGGDDWFYNAGWDDAHARRSVGRAALALSIQRAFDDGRGAFHLLRGDEEYKGYWATAVDHTATLTSAGPSS